MNLRTNLMAFVNAGYPSWLHERLFRHRLVLFRAYRIDLSKYRSWEKHE